MALALPSYISIQDAAQKYDLDEAGIRSKIENGTIKAAMIGETVVISESDAQNAAGKPLRKEDLPEYQAILKKIGNMGITLPDAAKRYGLNSSTIHRWYQKGIIKEVGRDVGLGGERIFYSEADVAYCAEVYNKMGGQGRRVFDSKGLPYKPKTGPLAISKT